MTTVRSIRLHIDLLYVLHAIAEREKGDHKRGSLNLLLLTIAREFAHRYCHRRHCSMDDLCREGERSYTETSITTRRADVRGERRAS